ncbi:hypothetical protein DPMN_027640 [Dreissena polymorpha]|uniref:Uncharacterized protein n=1 Tax=Dreissena polymorpha TaxID=45954 RepID=A0A9D4RFF1_DREPO|nr:hypothetical protein DPMN_027640 [Dreissena polymorpha]
MNTNNKKDQRTDLFWGAQDIIRTNVLTKFLRTGDNGQKAITKGHHGEKKTHEYSTVNAISRVRNAPPPSGHFHEDWTINVTLRVLTRLYYNLIRENAPPPDDYVFEQAGTLFFSRVLTRITSLIPGGHKNASPLGGHVFFANRNHFRTHSIHHWDNLLTEKNSPTPGEEMFLPSFYADWTINVTLRVLTRHI